MDAPWTEDLRTRLDELLVEYRSHLIGTLDDLSESEARRRLVPSKTTLLGLVKHVTYVERVWFDQAITGTPTGSTPDRSFTLRRDDTIETVVAAYRATIEGSRSRVGELPLDAEITGRGPRTLWAVYLQVLRELAHHSGHADILREQVLAARTD
jgi:uncharacterized damage-inducible protein DinB